MSSTTSPPPAQALEGNRLLALLNPETRRRMLPALTLISLDMNHPLYQPDRVITHIYFPLTAVTSVLSEMDDGTTVEVATIGREGMVGLSVFLGDETTFLRTIAQIPGTALSIGRDDFQGRSRIRRAASSPSCCAIPKPCLVSSPSSLRAIGCTLWRSGARGGF